MIIFILKALHERMYTVLDIWNLTGHSKTAIAAGSNYFLLE
jgi:hypothetical protein